MSLLTTNLAALAQHAPDVAGRIERAEPVQIGFLRANDGAWSGFYKMRWLASQRAPLAEAARVAADADPAKCGAAVVLGFGLGHHVYAALKRMARTGVVYLFEPDLGLIRAVLERIDCAGWLMAPNLVVLTDPDDRVAIARAMLGHEVRLMAGVGFVEHPADMARLGEASDRFTENVMLAYKALRSNYTTTIIQTETLTRNAISNIAHYAGVHAPNPGVGPLENRYAKRPAICVAAGPSFGVAKELLRTANLTDAFVLVSTQTTLRPLLRAGVPPRYICALDYHEISGRFYEGVTAEDVTGTDLVCTSEVHPIVPDRWPGRLRMIGDPMLDLIVGEPLSERIGTLPRVGTVGSMGHVLARYMGCDPVIHVGLDLAFTDGAYYGAGAAIHQVWAGELNEFRTLEMLEWERVARGKEANTKRPGYNGPVWTDAIMLCYAEEVAGLCKADADKGLTTIVTDAGLVKPHTVRMDLAEALGEYWPMTQIRPPPTGFYRFTDGMMARHLMAAAGKLTPT